MNVYSVSKKDNLKICMKIAVSVFVIAILFRIMMKWLGIVDFGMVHIVTSLIVLALGLGYLRGDNMKYSEWYLAILIVDVLMILCPAFFEIGRVFIRAMR